MTQNNLTVRMRTTGLVWVPIEQIDPHPLNWRTHPERQRRALRGAVESVGFGGALEAVERDGRYVLTDGHLRREELQAWFKPGELVPVIVEDFDDDEAREYITTKDPITSMAGGQQEILDELLRGMTTTNAAQLETMAEIAEANGLYFGSEPPAAVEDPGAQIDRAEELREKWQTERGQLWEIGAHRLLCGDSTDAGDVARLMGGERAATVVTSPPYNQSIDKFRPSGMHREGDWVGKVERMAYPDSMPEAEYQAKQRDLLNLWHDNVADGGSVFYNHKNRYRDKQVVSPWCWLPGPFRMRQEIIWSRPGSVTQNARMFLPSDERVFWMYKGDDFLFHDSTAIKSHSTVWDISLETNRDHAVGYPVEIPRRCIEATTNAGDVCADPFLGSGTTMVAAEQLARRCYGCEIEPKYVAVALERMSAMGLTPRLVLNAKA